MPNILGLVQELADLSEAAIDEEIAKLESQLGVLKMVRKNFIGKTVGGTPGTRRDTGRTFEECNVDRVVAVIEAIGKASSDEIRKQLPGVHHFTVIKQIDAAVESGRLRKDTSGKYSIPK